MIELNSIHIEGFGSICEPVTLDFTKGINVIRGKNGSGKTTIFNALLWNLYGSNTKDVNQDLLINKYSKGLLVLLSFNKGEDQYSVCRCYKHPEEGSRLVIFKNNDEMNHQHLSDAQSFLKNLLGIELKVFTNSVFFGQRVKRFIEGTGAEKREIFESLLDYAFIDHAVNKTNIEISETKSTISLNESKIHDLRSRNALLSSNLDIYENQKLNFNSDKSSKISAIESEISKFEQLLNESELKILDLTPIPDHLSDFKIDRTRRESIKPIKPLETCPTCESNLDKTKLKQLNSLYDSQLKVYNTEVKDYLLYLNNLSEFETITESNSLKKTDNTLNQFFINSTRDRILKLKEDLSNVKDSIFKESNIDSIKMEILQNSTTLDDFKIQLDLDVEYINILEWWLKNGFSSKGIKSFLLDDYLLKLNQSILKYSEKLGYNVEFSIDTSKLSKPFITKCWNGVLELDYNQFSGGEKARVDIITAFAMHDLIESSFDILIMDEIFEGLDKTGVEDVFELIRIKAENKSLYIITHSDIDALGVNVIEIVKDKSTIIL